MLWIDGFVLACADMPMRMLMRMSVRTSPRRRRAAHFAHPISRLSTRLPVRPSLIYSLVITHSLCTAYCSLCTACICLRMSLHTHVDTSRSSDRAVLEALVLEGTLFCHRSIFFVLPRLIFLFCHGSFFLFCHGSFFVLPRLNFCFATAQSSDVRAHACAHVYTTRARAHAWLHARPCTRQMLTINFSGL